MHPAFLSIRKYFLALIAVFLLLGFASSQDIKPVDPITPVPPITPVDPITPIPDKCSCGCGRDYSQCDMKKCSVLARFQKQLKGTISAAAERNKTDCANSVAAAAEAFGIKDLSGKRANAQIEFMEKNWTKLSPREAQILVNRGILVVAGKPGRPHGHVALPVPGSLDERYGHPRLAGGAFDPKDPKTPGKAYSKDGQTVNYIWQLNRDKPGAVKIEDIKYYTPPAR